MTQEALKLALEGVEIHSPNSPEYIVCAALIEALAQPEQEPVAWMRQDGQKVTTASDRHNYPDYETRYSIPLYTTPPQRTEQNFCSRCGKRLGGIDSIHTCTPPMEMNT